jgi:hypothetical protein
LVDVQVHRWSIETFDEASSSFKDADGRIPDWLVLPQSPLDMYTAVAPGLRRLADQHYELADRVAATREAADAGVYDPQDAFFLPVSGFGAILRPGPTILIYRRPGNQRA